MAEVRIRPGSLTVEVFDRGKLVGQVHVPELDLTVNSITVRKGPGGPWKARAGGQPVEVDRE